MMSRKLALLTVLGTIGGIALTIVLTQTLLQPLIDRLDWFENSGWMGAFVFLILYIPMGLLLVPASFHKFVAGMLFGFWIGWVIAWVGAMLGAIIPFILARRWLEPWVRTKIEANRLMVGIEEAIVEDGWFTVWLTRMSLVIPYAGLNYGFGATRVSFKNYVIGNLGMIVPGVLYAWWGSQADGIADAARDGGTPGYWAAMIGSAIITVGMVIHLRKLTLKHIAVDSGGVNTADE